MLKFLEFTLFILFPDSGLAIHTSLASSGYDIEELNFFEYMFFPRISESQRFGA